ncbi:MAG: hypothetical protein ACO3NE_11835 [Alphaproteobacteria bacterium]
MLNHALTPIEPDHDHIFGTNIVLRVVFVIFFACIVRWIAAVMRRWMPIWIFCAIGGAAVLFPMLLAVVMLTGKKPHVLSASSAVQVPYLMLILTYFANLLIATVYGVLGWALLCLPKTSEPDASV